jgi:hypothetical protein
VSGIVVSELALLLAKKAANYAQDWALKDVRPRGKFLGRCGEIPVPDDQVFAAGYDRGTPCCYVVQDASDSLRWRHESGVEYLIPNMLISDGGSTPRWSRILFKRWMDLNPFGKFKFAFFLHDGIFRNGGCMVRVNENAPWQFVEMDMSVANLILFQACTSLGGNNIECHGIFEGVEKGGRRYWLEHERRRESAKKVG